MTAEKLLIVVDYQVDFVTGALGFSGAAALEERICRKIEAFRAAGQDVIFTLDTHTPDYLQTKEGERLPVPHCVKGTPGWELAGRARSLAEGCVQLEKGTFGSAALLDYLRAHPYGAVELVGVVSNICVVSNAVIAKAALPEADIRVDARCTASPDPALEAKAFDVLENLHIAVDNR